LQIAFFSVSNEHQEQGAKVRNSQAIASLSNAAIGVHGQRKTAICGLSRYKHGFNPRMVIISDDAGQLNIFLHALCWIHAERTINKLVGFNEQQRQALVDIQN